MLPATFIFETLNASVALAYRRFRMKPAIDIWRDKAKKMSAHAAFLQAQEGYICMIQRMWRQRQSWQRSRVLREGVMKRRDMAARTIQSNTRVFLAQRRMLMQKLIIR